MKRFLFVALIFMMAFTVVFAQEAGTFSAGVRGGIGIGFNDFTSDMRDLIEDVFETKNYKVESMLHPVIAAYGYYTFAPNMAVQFEANFMINQGIKAVYSESIYDLSWDFMYMSLDIPVMFRYTFLNAPVSVGLLAGPYISIPISQLETGMTIKWGGVDMGSIPVDKLDMEGFGFGATAGVFVGYPLGPGSIIGDLRFLFDFVHPKLKGATDPFMNRRALNITVGYEMTF